LAATSPKVRILCTEDDAHTRELIVKTLQTVGYEVLCTDSAEETLNLAKTENFDLYLMDNWMPEIPGPEFTAKIWRA
jgi:CheY-like chemotaxis protein